MTTKQIPLKDLRIDGQTQQRDIDTKVVDRYAALMADGVKFPPVQVMFDGKSYWLIDGFHRFHSAAKLKKTTIEAVSEQGTQRQAQWASYAANRDSGFPRQDGTCKSIIEKILADEEYSELDDKGIAEHVGVTRRYVRKIKEGKKDTSTSGTSSGHKNKPKNAEKPKPDKEEKPDTQKNTEKKTTPKLMVNGREVPKHLVEIFNRRSEFREIMKQLDDIKKRVLDSCAAKDPLYAQIKVQSFETAVKNIRSVFRFALPFAVCGFCGGDKNNSECRNCGGRGWVAEIAHIATPKELKE